MPRGLKITKPQFHVVICYRGSAKACLILYYIHILKMHCFSKPTQDSTSVYLYYNFLFFNNY